MLIPAWHIALLWSLYALAYGLRIWQRKAARFRYIGKTAGRLIVAAAYWLVDVTPMNVDEWAVLIRWSLFIFPVIDMLFIIQERYEKTVNDAKPAQ